MDDRFGHSGEPASPRKWRLLVTCNSHKNHNRTSWSHSSALFISPVMVVLPASSVFEGDVVEVVCRVVEPPGSVDVYLTKGRKVLKQSAKVLHYRFTAGEGDGGEYVCKAEYGAAQKETYQTIRVKGQPTPPHYPVLVMLESLSGDVSGAYFVA